ncbi:ANTAR domain-containing protein [Kordiimonas pumila]|uniref:Response regulator n=1 Tax=Kordiimonas pumila TaxID=2161677 RepID=A0ABV7D6A8_9PROT|nr:response regulator [Kordiimonas pumila]
MGLGTANDLRVLIALENGQAAEGARDVFKKMGAPVVKVAATKGDVLEAMHQTVFNLVLVEDTFSDLGGLDFCRFIRMVSSPTSVAPLILAMKMPDRARVQEARDAGINRIIIMPFTTDSILKNVQDILDNPTPFIRVSGYSGPCRRKQNILKKGLERRQQQTGVLSVEAQKKLFKGI